MASLTEEMRHSNRSSGTSPSRDYRSDNTSRGRGQGRRGGYNNRAGNRRSQTPDGACFYCHELGHFKRDCPKLNNSPGSKPPTQNKQTERKSVTMKLPEDQATEGPSNGFTVVGTIGTAQLLRVQVKIQDKLVTALIDTGSEVTIMQDKVFDSLKEKPYVIKETLMHGAGREMQMTCRITNPTLFSIQDLLFNHNLYIAPIDCEMLLGHDFLASNNVILNIGQGYMSINDKTVKLVLGGETPSAQPSVSRITIPSSVVVPPNSVMRMNCTVPVQDNDFVIEPNSKTTLLIPRSVCAKGQSPVVCFMNVTDNPVRLQGGIEVAEAHAVTVIESMDDPQELSVGTCSTSKQGKEDLPDHLQELFTTSSQDLTTDQKSKLRTLLYTYSDVFAKTEFDLGNFSHVEHEIDTGDARPIQLRMRRTPACFVQEEEAHLKKMLDAGVIQPSTSEWASAPVLIRKKDGGVRWCIDFRRLNSVTSRPSFDEHLTNLQNVFARFREYGLRLKPKKCALFRTSVEFLGRSVSNQGLQIGQQHLQPVSGWVVPTCTKEVEQFLGFVNYHRSFIKDYAKISAPLYEVTGKNLFSWNHERQLAFQTLKDNLLSAPVLTLPNNKDYFILDTDASQNAIGAELIQVQDGEERTIAYGSFVLTAEQKRYCTTRKELLAVIRFTRQFRHYLLGRQFTVRTDHSSLTWLVNFKEPQGQLARWLEELSQYDLVIKHRPGKQHIDADVLSRLPDRLKECPHYTADTILASLPCKGCNYCQRAHQSWAQFLCDVDEAVPLARKRKQKPRLLKRVATAMMMLFETPEKVSTLEQPAVTS
ncbi:Hypothetical predicted protein [Mytilus galloprovincialis]|uniref:RNA-directed DNA polymerase n=1 Tax=Mytilus galloprovincialis TaxID=29158 RepID=A0A8B6DMD0_MYTGA|nr:Hypothetical predicted protein [Mytilus galloprovincialis]